MMTMYDPLNINLSEKRWVTIGQAATLTRSSERTIWRWIAQGKVVAITTAGGRTFVDRETLFLPIVPEMARNDSS
jgi:YD repeat-containing protein